MGKFKKNYDGPDFSGENNLIFEELIDEFPIDVEEEDDFPLEIDEDIIDYSEDEEFREDDPEQEDFPEEVSEEDDFPEQDFDEDFSDEAYEEEDYPEEALVEEDSFGGLTLDAEDFPEKIDDDEDFPEEALTDSGYLDDTDTIDKKQLENALGEDEDYLDDTGVIDSDYLDDTGIIDDTGFLDNTGVLDGEEIVAAADASSKEAEDSDHRDDDAGVLDEVEIEETDDEIVISDPDDIIAAIDSSEEPEENDDNTQHGFLDRIKKLTLLDGAIAAAAVAIIVGAGIGVTRYQGMTAINSQIESYRTIGCAVDSFETIGGSKMGEIAAERVKKDVIEAQREADAQKKADILADVGTVPVEMSLASIQSDLKIKIKQKDTQGLISGVPFKVKVVLPSGKTETFEDDDQDGIIYKTGLANGTYKVTMEQLVSDEDSEDAQTVLSEDFEKLSKYKIPTDEKTINVTDKIAYKAIDVKDEIKTEAQVNVAAEDTAKKTATESAVKDTVEWVASTKTAEDENYTQISKDDIPDPNLTAKGFVFGEFRKLAEETAGEEQTGEASVQAAAENDDESETASTDNEEENGGNEASTEEGGNNGDGGDAAEGSSEGDTSKKTYTTVIKGSTSVSKGKTVVITASTNEPGATGYSWSVEGSAISIDKTTGKNVTVKGEEEGTATLICTADIVAEDTDNRQNVIRTDITVTDDGEEGDGISIKVTPADITIASGKTQQLSCEINGIDDKSVKYESGNSEIASVDENGLVSGVSAGETLITVSSKADSSLKQDVKVKVVKGTDDNGNVLLKDKNGKQVYVKDNGVYREAVADDYSKFDTFYIKAAVDENPASGNIHYTGWQNIGGKTYYFNQAGEPVTGAQVINGASYTFDSNGVLQGGKTQVGIDVSTWNGNINWGAVSSSGISYAIIRCGYRGSSTGALIKDSAFSRNIAGASAAGLKVGMYVFSQATNEVEAVEEASMAVEMAAGYSVTMPIFIDIEAAGGRADAISAAQRTAVCEAFCKTVQAAGYKAGVYSNTSWFNHNVSTPSLTGYHIWLAQYAAAPTYTRTRYDIWQYSCKGRVNGISGDVDMDIAYRAY